jgi:hypothetical protein
MSDRPPPKPNRPSLQLMIDRTLARRFRAACIEDGTSASKVVTGWIEQYLRDRDARASAKRRTPRPPPAKPPRGKA